MRIQVRVKPNSKEALVENTPDGAYLVRVREAPHEGKANKALISALAAFFGVGKSCVHIVKGLSSKNKIIEIEGKR